MKSSTLTRSNDDKAVLSDSQRKRLAREILVASRKVATVLNNIDRQQHIKEASGMRTNKRSKHTSKIKKKTKKEKKSG